MGHKIVSGQTYVKSVSVSSPVIKSVTVGAPIKKVNEASQSIFSLEDTDFTNLQNGSLVKYESSSGKFISSLNVEEEQDINGGSY